MKSLWGCKPREALAGGRGHAWGQLNSPTMLHVLRLVHADGQFDPEITVRTAFGHGHLLQLGLFGAVGGWM